VNINLLLIERKGRTGEYWPEVVAKTTEGQYSPVWLEQARLVGSLLYGPRAMLVLNLMAFENKKNSAYDRFMAKSRPRKNQSERSDLQCLIIMVNIPQDEVEGNIHQYSRA